MDGKFGRGSQKSPGRGTPLPASAPHSVRTASALARCLASTGIYRGVPKQKSTQIAAAESVINSSYPVFRFDCLQSSKLAN